jgi:hypothetical protein
MKRCGSLRACVLVVLTCLIPGAAGAQVRPGPVTQQAAQSPVALPAGQHPVTPSARQDAPVESLVHGFTPGAESRLLESPDSRSHWLAGAVVGFVVGAGATHLVLRTGGSRSFCDRDSNQDALRASDCAWLAAGGGVIGAGIGALIGGRIRTGVRHDGSRGEFRVGIVPGDGARLSTQFRTHSR